MKGIFSILIAIFVTVTGASCQDRPSFKVTLSATDDKGVPVNDARIETDVFDRWQPSESFGQDVYKKFNLLTDPLGMSVFEYSTERCEMVFSARKEGYYWAGAAFRSYNKVKDQWQPWNPTLKLVMWRVQNPIPLMAKRIVDGWASPTNLPTFGKPVGYDFEVGDWVRPYGKGTASDILLQLDGQTEDADGPYGATLRISFSSVNDGLLLHKANEASGLKLPYLAPAEGYMPELVKRQTRSPALVTQIGARMNVTNDSRSGEHYFLRIRTQVDQNGKIISANYAKIYGGFEWYVNGGIKFQYHFNPTPNDRNLEFDPQRNLLKLPEEHQVTDP